MPAQQNADWRYSRCALGAFKPLLWRCWQIGRCFVALPPTHAHLHSVGGQSEWGYTYLDRQKGGKPGVEGSERLILADLMHVAEGNADEAWWTWHFKIYHAICTTATQLFKTSGIVSKVPGTYIFKGTSPPISLDFHHFAATFGNFHDIESSSTQAGTSILRLRIQVLLPRRPSRHRAAVLAAKWRRLASVPPEVAAQWCTGLMIWRRNLWYYYIGINIIIISL